MNKHTWHKTYKKSVWIHFNKACSECQKPTFEICDGVVHHWSYKHPGGIYNADPVELINLKKISWVCNPCHEKIHRTIQIDGSRMLSASRCRQCGISSEETEIYQSGLCENCKDLHDQNLPKYDINS